MTGRQRLDQVLVERGLAPTRSRARALIEAGLVRANGLAQDKPARTVAPDVAISIDDGAHPWASRAGLKLAAALDRFGIDPAGLTALDIGASTGGFTDVLLVRCARRVYAIDVGSGQLLARLRDDPRVVVREQLNARSLTLADVPEPIDLIVCDASFIGLETILPAPLALAKPQAHLIALIKPQFEVGPGKAGKGGIVRDPALHAAVCRRIEGWLGAQDGWQVIGLTESPIAGGDGNKEFLICARRTAANRP